MQTAKAVVVLSAPEASINATLAPGPISATATKIRFTPSPGLELKTAEIKSEEQREDGLETMGRNGSINVDGSYDGEMSIGSHDLWYAALWRAAFDTPLVTTQTDVTNVTVTDTHTLTAGSGTWAALGWREGDVFKLGGMSNAANNGIPIRIKSLAGTALTTHGDPLTVQALDNSFTMTRGKRLLNPATLVRQSFAIEQRSIDVDGSQVFTGCRIVGMKITGTPDGMAKISWTIMGLDGTTFTGVDSPYFTNPISYSSIPLVFADCKFSFGGSDIAVATAFEIDFKIDGASQPVIGSVVSPDLFDNDLMVEGSITMIRSSFANVIAHRAETEFDMHIMLREPGATPGYIAIHVPRTKFKNVSAPLGGKGAMLETIPFRTGAQVATSTKDFGVAKLITG